MKPTKQPVSGTRDRTVYVVRHGQTVGNREGRRIGHGDSPLTQHGIEQSLLFAAALARAIPDRSAVLVQSSPLFRARHTASLIADRLDLEPGQRSVSPLLLEQAFGQWEGFTKEEIEARFPGAQAARHRAHWTYTIPGGESYEHVSQRVREWFGLINTALVTIAVTHAKTSRVLRGVYLGLPQSLTLALKHPQDRIFELCNGEIQMIHCAQPRGLERSAARCSM